MYTPGQEVFTIFDSRAYEAPLLFKTTVVATEEFGGRTVYILETYNKDIIKKGKGKPWAQIKPLYREERHTTEEEDIYLTLEAALDAQNKIYDAKIANVEKERALFMSQATQFQQPV